MIMSDENMTNNKRISNVELVKAKAKTKHGAKLRELTLQVKLILKPTQSQLDNELDAKLTLVLALKIDLNKAVAKTQAKAKTNKVVAKARKTTRDGASPRAEIENR